MDTQPYIYGKEVHLENLNEDLWNIYMVGLGGYPVMRDLSHEAAEFIVDCINSSVPKEEEVIKKNNGQEFTKCPDCKEIAVIKAKELPYVCTACGSNSGYYASKYINNE